MKRALIIGFGMSGRAAARELLRQGYTLDVYDDSLEKVLKDPECRTFPQDKVAFFNQIPSSFPYSKAAISPGISREHPVATAAKRAGVPLFGEIDLAFETLEREALAITGSNGKTTTALLTAHLLQASGISAEAAGNNEVPLSDWHHRTPKETVAVIELSSYQLEELSHKRLAAGILLNIYPNHLDRHGTMEAYAKAKFRLKECMKEGGVLWAHSQVIDAFPELAKASFVRSTEPLKRELGFSGRLTTFQENLLAAYALTKSYRINPQDVIKHSQTFIFPPHRMQHVGTFRGVEVYNDSKGTTVEAVLRAVESFEKPVHLIAGGRGKGAPYTPWRRAFPGRVAAVHLIGEEKHAIAEELSGALPIEKHETLQEAVQAAVCAAKSGEAILLSPGCASWDMFTSYRERGERFTRLILDSYNSGGVGD